MDYILGPILTIGWRILSRRHRRGFSHSMEDVHTAWMDGRMDGWIMDDVSAFGEIGFGRGRNGQCNLLSHCRQRGGRLGTVLGSNRLPFRHRWERSLLYVRERGGGMDDGAGGGGVRCVYRRIRVVCRLVYLVDAGGYRDRGRC